MDGRWHNQVSVLANQGDFHYHLPHRPARAAVRAIPYPRNEDVVRRNDLFDKLNKLLPSTTTQYHAAALYGLGGSGSRSIMPTDDATTKAAPSSGFMRILRLAASKNHGGRYDGVLVFVDRDRR
ncbi:hypothetical protein S40293_11442 [Stachybotrys chartarum IBT 40293]|nr:hypothetical protein S40293_11442 [Stachybotrys chartarum IBT 40293]